MESRRGGGPEDDGVGLRDADVTHSGEIVGRGGSGVVRKGTLRLPDGTVVAVAIKMLHAGATESEERSFRKELRVGQRASERCPRACQIYGCVRHEGALCLVMKLYRRSLHVVLDERRSPDGSNYVRPLRPEEVSALCTQILEGLGQLHAEGIVVQDLKPANILLDERDQLVISDFGLAAVLHGTVSAAQSSTTTVPGGGTPAYRAPEQYDEEAFGRITPKTDMWAFACVAIELLAGFAPWRGKQPMQIMMSVAGKGQAPAVPEQAPEPLSQLLGSCLSHAQDARPTAAQALEALRQLAGESGASDSSGTAGQMLEQERRLRQAAEQQVAVERQLRQAAEQANAQLQHANAQLRAETEAKGVAQQHTQQALAQCQEVQQAQHRQLEAAQQQLVVERARCAEVERTNAQMHVDAEAQGAALADERRQRQRAQQELQRCQQALRERETTIAQLQGAGGRVGGGAARRPREAVPPAARQRAKCQSGANACTCGGGCKCGWCGQPLPTSGTRKCKSCPCPCLPEPAG